MYLSNAMSTDFESQLWKLIFFILHSHLYCALHYIYIFFTLAQEQTHLALKELYKNVNGSYIKMSMVSPMLVIM